VVALPSLCRLLRDFTTLHPGSEDVLDSLAAQLEAARDLPALAAWFERAFAALVTVNLRIGGALVVAVPFWPLRAPEVVTAAMAREFQALEAAPSVERIVAFELRWGHRGEYETDPARPRGEETRRPGSPLALALRPRLPDPLASLPLPLRRVPMLAPRHLLAHREWFRDGAMRLWTAFRARVLLHAHACVASGLFDQPEDAWQLTTAELRTLPPTSWRERIAARCGLPPTEIDADLFWSDTLTPFGAVPLGRLPLVPGTVSGPALVARTPAEALALLAALPVAGERPILIAPAVDPGWLPVFVRAGGVATELGGRLSHAATLLRELAIPSVLNLAGATASARTGDRVRLRVPPGVIEIVEPRETAPRHPAESGARL
jgi:phosphohistidine swiveling domain-containing protein